MAKKEIYAYDYQNGIATQREQAFRAVMQKQLQYDFLKHKEIAQSTSEEKRKVLDNINKRIARLNKTLKEKLSATVLALMMIFVIGLTSCDKEPIEPTFIEQSFSVKTVITQDIRTKSYNPDAFIVEYSTVPTTLTLQSTTSPTSIFTKECTAQELIDGLVTMTIIPDTYTVTFGSTHPTTIFSNRMDIAINETKQCDGTPVTLTATLEDFLVVYDIPYGERNAPILSVKSTVDNSVLTKQNDYWYGYANTQTNLLINYNEVYYNGGMLQEAYAATQVMPTMDLGKLYWVLRGFNGTFIIDIPQLSIEQIIVE